MTHDDNVLQNFCLPHNEYHEIHNKINPILFHFSHCRFDSSIYASTVIPYKMLGMLIPTALPCTPNAWKIWVDHIMKQKKVYGFKKAAIAHENGMTTSATPGLILPIPEIQVNLLI